MHKNNRIYLLNILHCSQPCGDRLNRTQPCWICCFLSVLAERRLPRTWQPMMFAFMSLSCVSLLSYLYIVNPWYRIMVRDGEWQKERNKGADLKSKGAGKKCERQEQEAGDRERDRVSCVKWINVSRSFIVRLS